MLALPCMAVENEQNEHRVQAQGSTFVYLIPDYLKRKIDVLVCAKRISPTKVADSLQVRLYGGINRN